VREIVADAPPNVRWLLLNAEAIVHVDATAMDALRALHEELSAQGITLAVARVKGPLRKAFEATGLIEQIGRALIFPTVASGVSAYLARNQDSGADPE
jgi:MFS superfamily sulfate permease-like transporter